MEQPLLGPILPSGRGHRGVISCLLTAIRRIAGGLMIGQTVSHYRILSKLGAGGMGVVYQAEDLSLQRTVALKFLLPDSIAGVADRSRLVHEARAAAALLHPNICPVYEIAESDGQVFIVMAYVEGSSLRDRLLEGPLSPEDALKIASEVGQALAAAHGKGIVHRDVKPANVMITPEGRAVLMDFGLARMRGATRLTRSGAAVGTAAYMSPEQLQGAEVDARTDLWSLGVMLYEMVSGRLPFEADFEPALAYQITHRDPEPIARVPGLPAGLPGVIAKALAKNPAERYGSARDLVADIDELRADSASTPAGRARPAARLGHRWRTWRTRTRVAALGAVSVGLAAAAWGAIVFWPGAGQAIDSIAVLPLQNLSGDPEQEYFVDGMTDELIGQLGKVHALTVISRTSSMRYKDTDKSLADIARELSVDAVVEGSVRRDGDRVRISIDLVNARTDRSLWSDTYDMAMMGIFAVQTEVAMQVVAALRTRLSPEERKRMEGRPPTSAEAYQLYLKGQYFANKRVESATRKAIRCYEQAIELDPGFAAAFAALGIAYGSLSVYGVVPPDEAFVPARKYALKALELDETLASAHATVASLNMREWNWQEGAEEYARAVELGPNDPLIRDNYAFFLMWIGRTDEAVIQQERAAELDPLRVGFRQNLGEVLYYARRYEESIVASLEAIEMEPDLPQSHMFLGMAYAALGRTDDAVKALDRDREISGGRKPEIDSWIGVAYALANQTGRAREIYSQRVRLSESIFIDAFPLACMCFVLGNVDEGFKWLEMGYERKDPRMAFLKVHPACDSVRGDPRYVDMLKKVGMNPGL